MADQWLKCENIKYHIECLETPLFLETEIVSERVKLCKERNYLRNVSRE